MLVDVLALLRDDLPQLALVITGEGPDRPRLQARARDLGVQERVRFTGMVDAATLRGLYRGAFLTCFPALRQTWGLTPFEALCQRRVSLVSSQAGVAEVLQAQQIGLVAEPDARAFAEQIRAARRHSALIDAMAARGFAFVRTLTWRRFAEEMGEVFEAAA
jgi:glycosyltransferase involved in cell wall biosynthesis